MHCCLLGEAPSATGRTVRLKAASTRCNPALLVLMGSPRSVMVALDVADAMPPGLVSCCWDVLVLLDCLDLLPLPLPPLPGPLGRRPPLPRPCAPVKHKHRSSSSRLSTMAPARPTPLRMRCCQCFWNFIHVQRMAPTDMGPFCASMQLRQNLSIHCEQQYKLSSLKMPMRNHVWRRISMTSLTFQV